MRPVLATLLVALTLTGGCAFSSGVSFSARNPAVHFTVSEDYKLTYAGKVTGQVPSDETITHAPTAVMETALFTKGSDSIDSFVIVSRAQLLPANWDFDLERKTFHVVSLNGFKDIGQFWTEQVIMPNAKRDWYSALWRANGKTTPDKWIAMRYSATPTKKARILVEYREAATPCMEEYWNPDTADTRAVMYGMCQNDIKEFRTRAKAAIGIAAGYAEPSVGNLPVTATEGNLQTLKSPGVSVNYSELLGRSVPNNQSKDRDKDYMP